MAGQELTEEEIAELDALFMKGDSPQGGRDIVADIDAMIASGEISDEPIDDEPIGDEREYKDLGLFDASMNAIEKGAGKAYDMVSGAVGGAIDALPEIGEGLYRTGKLGIDYAMGNDEAIESFQRDFGAGLGVAGEAAKAVVANPEALVDSAGHTVSTVAPLAFGPAGALAIPATNTAWNYFTDLIGLNDNEEGMDLEIDKSGVEHFAEALEDTAPDLLFAAAGQVVRQGSIGATKLRDVLKGRVKTTAFANTPKNRLARIFKSGAKNVDMDKVDAALENLGDEIAGRMVMDGRVDTHTVGDKLYDMLKGKQKFSKGGKSTVGVVGRRSGGMIDDLAKDVHSAIAKSSAKVTVPEVTSMIEDAFRPIRDVDEYKNFVRQAKGLVMGKFKVAAAKAANYSDASIEWLSDKGRQALIKNKQAYKALQAKKNQGLTRVEQARLRALQKSIPSLQKRINDFDDAINSVEFDSNQFFDTVRDVTSNVKFDSNIGSYKRDILETFRNAAKDKIRAALPDSAAMDAYDLANANYWSAEELAKFANNIRKAETTTSKVAGNAIMDAGRAAKDVKFFNKGQTTYRDEWNAIVGAKTLRTADRASGLSQVMNAVFSPLEVFRGFRNVDQIFNIKNAAVFEAAFDTLNDSIEGMSLSDSEMEQVEKLAISMQRMASAARDGAGADIPTQKSMLKDLYSDPTTRIFVPKPSIALEGHPHIKGVAVVGDEPLSPEDEMRYRTNLKRDESLSNVERAKHIRHLNKFGKIMAPKEKEIVISPSERADAERETSRVDALNNLKQMKSSKDLVKRNTLSQINKRAAMVKNVNFTPEDAHGLLLQSLADENIENAAEVSQFLGQMAHESMDFTRMEEAGSGKRYEGRRDLGNTQPGDGERYKGRGFIQLTGRYNYKKYGKMIGVDLEGSPELASDPEIAARIAVAYWKDRVKGKVKDFSDTKAVTKAINGGYNGLKDRERKVKRFMEQDSVMEMFGLEKA